MRAVLTRRPTGTPGRIRGAARLALPLLCAAVVTVACASTPAPRPATPAPRTATPTPATPATPGAPATAREIIAALKEYEARVGFAPTGNFARATNEAWPGRCYYTGALELPDSYRGLRVVPLLNGRCPVDGTAFDVFPYALETAATGASAITPALEGATLERLLMVVPHEDFHNQPEAQRAPPALAEAAATLAGFVTATGFARERFGLDSALVEHLAREADLYDRKAAIVNGYYRDVATLYAAVRESRVTRDEALERKRVLFRELGEACLGSGPTPVSFNRCPAVLNNAGLAFDRTYTRDYPPLFASWAKRRDGSVSDTIRALRDLLTQPDR